MYILMYSLYKVSKSPLCHPFCADSIHFFFNLRPFIQIRTYHTFFCVFNFRLCVSDCPNWRFFVFQGMLCNFLHTKQCLASISLPVSNTPHLLVVKIFLNAAIANYLEAHVCKQPAMASLGTYVCLRQLLPRWDG